MLRCMESIAMWTSRIPWWFRTILRGPGTIAKNRGDRAEEKPMFLWALWQFSQHDQLFINYVTGRNAQNAPQPKATSGSER